MSTAYAPVATILPGTITLPQDLVDQRSAASVNVPFKTLADAIAYLMASDAHFAGMSLISPVAYSAEITKTYDVSAIDLTPITDGTIVDDTGRAKRVRFVTVQTGSSTARHLVWDITHLLIHGGTLSSAIVQVTGPVGHGALPAVMPAVAVVRHDASADTWESLLAAGMYDDPSPDIATYETTHEITFTPDRYNTIDVKRYSYILVGCNEGGANALEQFMFLHVYTNVAAARYKA